MNSTTWHFQTALESFPRFRERWDALNAQRSGHILLDSAYVDCLLRHFGASDVLLGVQEGDPGGIVLVRKKSAAIWETFQPSQAPIGLVIPGRTNDVASTFGSLLQSLPGYALQMSILHQDPSYVPFNAGQTTNQLDKLDYIQTAQIPLQGTFEEYWGSREGRLRKNNDRLRRRMAEKGLRLEFVEITEPPEIAAAIAEYGRLEAKGWKAKEGTAVAPDNVQGKFYRELLETFCARREGIVYQLRIDGTVVASDICLFRNDMLVLLKTAYDEEWSVYSPAFLMREDIVRSLYSRGTVKKFEFYGPLMDYQLRWTSEIRTLYHLTCYRHPWVKSLRKLAKRFL